MAKHDFRGLYAAYPSLIRRMPKVFTSHDFIGRLAQSEQGLYVDALCTYAKTLCRGKPAPFMIVHSILSRRLSAYPELVRRLGHTSSRDVFGQVTRCSEWERLPLVQYPLPTLPA